ncbi:MAG TPA: hypothetical protein VF796_28820 [Humisphaera sp.]
MGPVPDYRPAPRPRRRRRIVVLAVVAGLLLAASWAVGRLRRGASPIPGMPLWSAGKHKESPDGRFKAEGLVQHDDGRSWCTMEVVELTTGRRVFYLEQPIGPSDRQPWFDQGNSLHDGIDWAADSASVTFEGKNGQTFVVPVR